PVSLRTTLRLVLDSCMPMCVLWGPDLIQLYNDEYRILMGAKHPAALGQSNRTSWAEVWHLNQPIYARVQSGESVGLSDALYPITLHGAREAAWFDLCFAPVRDEAGVVAGVLATVVETTARVLSRRRLRTLHAVTASTAGATSVHAAMQCAFTSLAGGAGPDGSAQDVPFALGYLLDERTRLAHLVASAGVEPGGPMAPRTIDVRGGHPTWPLASALAMEADRSALCLNDLAERFRGTHVGPQGELPAAAV